MFNALEEGDIDEALNAASSIGDDTLQKKYHGHSRSEPGLPAQGLCQ